MFFVSVRRICFNLVCSPSSSTMSNWGGWPPCGWVFSLCKAEGPFSPQFGHWLILQLGVQRVLDSVNLDLPFLLQSSPDWLHRELATWVSSSKLTSKWWSWRWPSASIEFLRDKTSAWIYYKVSAITHQTVISLVKTGISILFKLKSNVWLENLMQPHN